MLPPGRPWRAAAFHGIWDNDAGRRNCRADPHRATGVLGSGHLRTAFLIAAALPALLLLAGSF